MANFLVSWLTAAKSWFADPEFSPPLPDPNQNLDPPDNLLVVLNSFFQNFLLSKPLFSSKNAISIDLR
jgi:hypothetical protein